MDTCLSFFRRHTFVSEGFIVGAFEETVEEDWAYNVQKKDVN